MGLDQTRKRLWSKNIVDYVVKEGGESLRYAVRQARRIVMNRSVKVLVVEDWTWARGLIVGLLRVHRYQVLEAGNGREGLRVLHDHPDIRLIITDYEMPEMDGVKFIRRVRERHPKGSWRSSASPAMSWSFYLPVPEERGQRLFDQALFQRGILLPRVPEHGSSGIHPDHQGVFRAGFPDRSVQFGAIFSITGPARDREKPRKRAEWFTWLCSILTISSGSTTCTVMTWAMRFWRNWA